MVGSARSEFAAEFLDLTNLYGIPPKIIWLKTGNRKSSELSELFLRKSETIKEFLSDHSLVDLACLELEE
jgi:predicted nuclease of predicted toxin-antitoxin system